MAVVQRIFEMMGGDGESIYGTARMSAVPTRMPCQSSRTARTVISTLSPCILDLVVHNAAGSVGATGRFLLGPGFFAKTARKHSSSRP